MNSTIVNRDEEEVVLKDINRTSPPPHACIASGRGKLGVKKSVHGGHTRHAGDLPTAMGKELEVEIDHHIV